MERAKIIQIDGQGQSMDEFDQRAEFIEIDRQGQLGQSMDESDSPELSDEQKYVLSAKAAVILTEHLQIKRQLTFIKLF